MTMHGDDEVCKELAKNERLSNKKCFACMHFFHICLLHTARIKTSFQINISLNNQIFIASSLHLFHLQHFLGCCISIFFSLIQIFFNFLLFSLSPSLQQPASIHLDNSFALHRINFIQKQQHWNGINWI